MEGLLLITYTFIFIYLYSNWKGEGDMGGLPSITYSLFFFQFCKLEGWKRWGEGLPSIYQSPTHLLVCFFLVFKLDGWRRHYNVLLITFPKLFDLPFFFSLLFFGSTFFFIRCNFSWVMLEENVRGRCECKSIWWENKGRHQWYNECGKYKLLLLCKNIQNKYQNYV
jgi:hypothetical protein